MIRRVSSRPRLVSDADRAFQNATVEDSDFSDGDGYAFGDGLDFDDDRPLQGDGDGDSGGGGLYLGGGGLGRSGGGAQRIHDGKGRACLHQDAVMAADGDGPAKAKAGAAFSISGEPMTPVAAGDGFSSGGDNPPPASVTDCDRCNRLACQAEPSPLSSSLDDDNDDDENDLSQFLSCYDLMELQTTFQKQASLPSEKEEAPRDRASPAAVPQDRGCWSPTTAFLTPSATPSTSAKRKRLFQHRLAPLPFAAPTPFPALASPLAPKRPARSQSATAVAGPRPSLLDLPAEDVLVGVASHLSLREVRLLATTCRTLRMTLVAGAGAATEIWMGELRDKFPDVFSRIDGAEPSRPKPGRQVGTRSGVSYQDVKFVDDHHLPVAGLSDGKLGDDDGSGDGGVNLPLLAGLLPARYPRSVDETTLGPFRSYAMPIDVKSGMALSQGPKNDDELQAAATATMVPVVQFTGRVNRGNRCIRSDAPFPDFRAVSHGVGVDGLDEASDGGFRGLSSWVKSHAPRRQWSRKGRGSLSRGGGTSAAATAGSELVNGVNPYLGLAAVAAHGYLAPPPLVAAAAFAPYAAWSIYSQHSPMHRFLSSLNHEINNDSHTSSIGDEESSYEENLAEDGVKGGAMKHVLFKTCKECLGKLQRHGRRPSLEPSGGLRPFVVPTVVSDNSRAGGKLAVDVTPRLVAYFEVTIVKQGAGGPPGDAARATDDDAERRRRAAAAFVRLAEERGVQHRQRPPPALHNRLFRAPPRAFPAMDLPLLHGSLILLERDARREAHEAFLDRRNREMDEADRRRADENRLRADPPRRDARHRHECVAIGLSTSAFRPHDKMPGWDDDSFGYHGDDGGLFHGRGEMLRAYGPPYGPGDTVGCGMDYSSGRAFFVKNGAFLGWAFGEGEVPGGPLGRGGDGGDGRRGLYPTVGVDTDCPVFVNYGEFPFAFDLRGFARSVAEGRDVEVDDESAW